MSELEKVKCVTPDLAEETAKNILALLPECAGEGGMVDIEKLKQCLSSRVIEGNVERYEFTWPGKRAAKAAASAATTKTLRPCRQESVGKDGTPGNFDSENLYIEGDNLEVLKLLQTSYAGQVKMIYIDPPYNTGHDFVYRDRFSLTQKELESEAGAFDADGNRFEVNDSSEARYHSNWCSMMYPRLKLARNLLRDDGVIFISIDDNEISNLKRLSDEIFGEAQFLAQISIIVKTEGRQYGSFAKTHEYLLVYAKSIFSVATNEVRDANGSFRYSDEKGGFNIIGLRNRAVRIFNSSNRPNLRYPIYVDVKNPTEDGFFQVSTLPQEDWTEVWPSVVDGLESVWRWGKDTAEKNKGELLAMRSPDGEIRVFKKDRSLTVMPKTVWFEKELNSIYGTREVAALVGKGLFDFPKPLTLLKKAVEIGTSEDSLVVDFFSGSATTAHAVMQLNAEDNGNRRYILVQLPESCADDSEAAKAGYKNICEIGKERIRRAGAKIREENALTAPNLDIGFRVLKLDSSSLVDTSATPANTTQDFKLFERIKMDRTPEDLLFQILLETHLALTDPIEVKEVGGNKVFFVAGNALVACLDDNSKMSTQFFEALAKLKPALAFFRDDTFADDSARTNVAQVFAQFSPNTTIKVI